MPNQQNSFQNPINEFHLPHAQSQLPLQGVTVLVVEDSRFACDALRLLCQRNGARLRRAENLATAKAHLRVYVPEVLIIDLGLPDGRGEDLIGQLSQNGNRPGLILATSGQPEGRDSAITAGADGFLEKPIKSLATLVHLLSGDLTPLGLIDHANDADQLALREDMEHAAFSLQQKQTPHLQTYIGGFVLGIATHAGDAPLQAAARVALSPDGSIGPLQKLLLRRLQTDDRTKPQH
ncbi:MAG: hypothetical protein RIR95_772 [Pseudomonadota bacterium]